MENQDKIQDVLGSFQKSPSKDIPPLLEEYLRTVAKTGKTVFPWQQLKVLFVQKLEQVMEQFHKDDPCDHHAPFPNVENTKFNEMRQHITDAFQRFNGAPFTVQRICELVTQPKKHYTQCDKFLRGIEKNVMVVSTIDPCGRKIVSESRALVNGLDMNGLNQQRGDLNDITDGQPFGPMPLADWPGNNVATVWPQPTATDNKNNSNSKNEEQNNSEEVNELKSDKSVEEKDDSGLAKAVPEIESNEYQLVVKDSVIKDSVDLAVSSTSLSSELKDKTEKSEIIDTENNTNQEISKEESPETVKQSSEISVEGKPSADTQSKSQDSVDEKDADKGTSCEKHAMEVTDVAEDEPPEKRLKVDHTEEFQEPVLNERKVPDSTQDSSQVIESSTSSQPTEKSKSATVTLNEISSQNKEISDESGVPDSGSSEIKQQPEVTDANPEENQGTTTQNTVESDQAEIRLENTETHSKSIENPASEQDVSTETVSDNAENTSSAEDKKSDEKQESKEVDSTGEQTVDSNLTAEVMETDTVPEKKDTTVDPPEAIDETEPMDQE